MNISQIYILIAIIVLLVVAALVFFLRVNHNDKRLTPLAGLAFGFVIAGLVFGQERSIGYGLMGVGVILAVVDMIRKS
ncbi:MAG TPA: hypothetical protein VLM80_08530 [Anaerolineales bacterium]|nr:hypothetical protein [Anaerolineales bacterium]